MSGSTLLFNRVGVNKQQQINEDPFCRIPLTTWFVECCFCIILNIIITVCRYFFIKKHRKESLILYFSDLLGYNLILSAVLIQGNIYYFSESNLCSQSINLLTINFYYMFCLLIILGYVQFIKTIMIIFIIPFQGYILHKLVSIRMLPQNQNQQVQDVL